MMVVIYLLFVAGASISDYFRNKEIQASNHRVREAITVEKAMIDSLMEIPQFIQNPVENQEREEKRKKAFDYAFETAFSRSGRIGYFAGDDGSVGRADQCRWPERPSASASLSSSRAAVS